MATDQQFVLLLAAASLAVLYRCGVLRRSAFKRAPRRDVGLHPEDILVGFAILIAGSGVVSVFIANRGDAAGQSAGAYAGRVLLGQASLLPLVSFIIWRVTRQSGGGPRRLDRFGLLSKHPIRHVVCGVVGLLAALPIVFGVGVLTTFLSQRYVETPPTIAHEMLDVVRRSKSFAATAALLVSAVLVAPVLEEIIYRGLLQTSLLGLGRQKRWSVILVASAWFTLIHHTVVWQGKPMLFVLSICLGWLYERTGSLWPGMVVHMAFNALNMAWVLLALSG